MSAYFGGEWADFISGGAGGGGITDLPVTFYYANTEPTSANIGDRWIDSETLVQFTYVNDGTSTQWVETTTRSSTGANRSLSNLTANTAINQHLIPAANVTYDLGTSSLRWRDLYLSGNTIDLGGTAIKTTANGVTFSSAANAAAMMPIMVHSLQLGTGNTAVTLHSSGGQLQTVTSTGTTAPVFDGNTSNILRTTNTTVSTSTVSGALQVAGGAGIAGNVYAGAVYTNSLFYANGSAFVSGVTIGGSSGQIQYNNGGSLAGSANLVWDNANVRLGIGNASPQHSFHTSGDVGIASRLHFTVANAYGGNYGILGLNWGGAVGTYKDFTIYDYVNSREMFTVTGSSRNITVFGTGLSNTDFRAPIFYDSDDTSYYVNPAGTSILNNARANNFHDSTGTYNVNLGSPSEGRGLVAGYSGGWYAGIGYNVRHSGSTGVMYAPSADTALYLNFGNTNRFNFWFNNSGAAGRSISWTEPGFLDNSGIMQVTGSHRAPIFYDSNDTNYYLDPAGTSSLNTVRFNSGATAGPYFYYGNNQSNLYLRGSAGTSVGLSMYDSSNTWRCQLYGDSTGYGFLNSNWGGWDLRKLPNGALYMNNDNSHYLSLGGTSYINGLTIDGDIVPNYSNRYGALEGSFWQRVLAPNQIVNLFAFNAPNTYEVWNGSAWVSGGAVPTDTFRGLAAHAFGGFGIGYNAYSKVRFTWNNFGYKFYQNLATAGSTNGNSFRILLYTSPNGTTWNLQYTSAWCSDWPGYHVMNCAAANYDSPNYGLRLEIEISWANYSTGISFGDIALWGGYGGFTNRTPPISWDYTQSIYAGNACYATVFYDSSNSAYYVDPAAGVSINVAGEIRAANNITAYYSDMRLKRDLGTIEQPLLKLKKLRGFYYEANETAQKLGYRPIREVGVSAQDVADVLPEIVKPAPIDEKYLTIHYERLVPLLIEAIKELNLKVERLEQGTT
jgi:hypothetical protein